MSGVPPLYLAPVAQHPAWYPPRPGPPFLRLAPTHCQNDRMTSRRFPPPWDIEEANASCFIVKDNNGQALAYVYYEDKPGRRAAVGPCTAEMFSGTPAGRP